MQVLEATYHITTPMFLAGHVGKAELRAPSFRGVLRFWFRATALGQLGSWQEVRAVEKHIFGSADKGQGGFLMRIQPGLRPERVERGRDWPGGAGSAYLGYGCTPDRPYIRAGQTFTVVLQLRPCLEERDLERLVLALKAMGLFGGLGSRSRRGFGSLSLMRLRLGREELWQAPVTVEGLVAAIRRCLDQMSPLPPELPEYTAFSRQSLVRVAALPGPGGAPRHSDPDFWGLDTIGREMLRFRSYGLSGRGGRVTAAGDAAEQLFRQDHDDLYALAATGKLPAKRAPQRAIFGLPHNYWFSRLRAAVNVAPQSHDRRASPLLIHVHHLQAGGQAAVFTFLPARFLPADEQVCVQVTKPSRGQPYVVPAPEDWSPIRRLLERWKGVSLP